MNNNNQMRKAPIVEDDEKLWISVTVRVIEQAAPLIHLRLQLHPLLWL